MSESVQFPGYQVDVLLHGGYDGAGGHRVGPAVRALPHHGHARVQAALSARAPHGQRGQW